MIRRFECKSLRRSYLHVTAAGFCAVWSVGCASVPPSGGGGGNGGNGNDNTDGTTQRSFVGAERCSFCHQETHAIWSDTRHAEALESLRASGEHENAACIGCHTVGFGQPGGYVDEATTPDLVGVQCESCHGPGSAHANDPTDLSVRPAINLAASMCGTCHTSAHHPTYDEWQLSKHGNALAGLRTSAFASDECLECHSLDYRYAIARMEDDDADNDLTVPTLASAQLSVECATCHTGHGGTENPAQLRLPVGQLCGQCHTVEESTLGASPHHPQIETLEGTGAFEASGQELVQSGPHSGLFANDRGEACAQCHVVKHDVEEPNDGNPNVTGHTFNPFDMAIEQHQAPQYTGCLDCHDEAGAAERRGLVQAEIGGRLMVLAPYFDSGTEQYIDRDSLPTPDDMARLDVAKFNYQYVNADGSIGVHNPTYARETLDIAETIIDDLSP